MVLNWLEKEGAGGAGRLSRELRGRFSCMPAQVRRCTPVRRSEFIQFILHSHEIFPSLFSFYFKIWVFVFESVTFCLSESVLLSEKSTQAHSASVICFTLFSIQENELQLRLSGGLLSGWSHVEVKNVSPSFILPLSLPSFSSLSLFQESKRYQSPCLHLHVTYPQKQSEESGVCGFQIKNHPRVCRLRVSVSPAPPR